MTTKKELKNRLAKLEEMYATETDHRKKTAILNLIFEIAAMLGILATWFFPKYGKKKIEQISTEAAWKAIFEYDEGNVPEQKKYLTIPQLMKYPDKYTAYTDACTALNTAIAANDTTGIENAKKAKLEARLNPEYKETDEGKTKAEKKAEKKAENKAEKKAEKK